MASPRAGLEREGNQVLKLFRTHNTDRFWVLNTENQEVLFVPLYPEIINYDGNVWMHLHEMNAEDLVFMELSDFFQEMDFTPQTLADAIDRECRHLSE